MDHYLYVIALMKMLISMAIVYGLLSGELLPMIDQASLFAIATWAVTFVNTVHLLGDIVTGRIQQRIIKHYEQQISDEIYKRKVAEGWQKIQSTFYGYRE